MSSWAVTPEDHLLGAYLETNPGELFLEVEVGGRGAARPRRIDGVLVPGDEKIVHTQGSYSPDRVAEAVEGREIEIIEAKLRLNRPVIGQVLAGIKLFERRFEPAQVVGVVVCGRGNEDLEWFCEEEGIQLGVFPSAVPSRRQGRRSSPTKDVLRTDQRLPPDPARRRAFMSGWDDAVGGTLYSSIRKKKTHQNMGNLFGWIYGEQDQDFREATWDRYVEVFGPAK